MNSWLEHGKAQVENFRKAYPNVIGNLGRLGEEELSRKFAQEQMNSDMGGSMAVKPAAFERILLQLLNDGWEKNSPRRKGLK